MLFLLPLLPLLALTSASPVHKRYTSVKTQSNRNGQCLSPQGDAIGNGVRVGTVPCDQAHKWDINPGSGSVLLSGTEFALDAGTGNDDNEIVKLWRSYPGLYQQTWYLTDDARIAITGGAQCLDQGNEEEGTQTWRCTTGNNNQIWNVLPEGDTPIPEPEPQPTLGKGAIKARGYEGLCVTVSGGSEDNGPTVDLSNCFEDTWPFAHLQRWQPLSGTTDIDKLSLVSHPHLCLSAGENPSNGGRLHLNACDGVATGQWERTRDGKYKLFGTNLCLDVKQESQLFPQKPYAIFKELQVWECSEGNTNQVFDVAQ
ncbi:hypothetical protein I302_103805 [Kwoniella bestiolae CBS 10118]|uniref:Ricin B lectin domain-containing protein n=1 Tax=Kwoniella bestiolae CBS 10118 TaxID=1296100 RepID=A0A1B9G9E7_9TREE|nr:hypothetical protein I302_02508 [Kwoniella bestiolae CBS 10118]OCF27664.1 hypothetical protein I302_02508 [Kwoniella bestiolae CBS 10118]